MHITHKLKHKVDTILMRAHAPQKWSDATYKIEHHLLRHTKPGTARDTIRALRYLEGRGKIDIDHLKISVWTPDGSLRLGVLKHYAMILPDKYLEKVLEKEWALILAGHTLKDDIEVE